MWGAGYLILSHVTIRALTGVRVFDIFSESRKNRDYSSLVRLELLDRRTSPTYLLNDGSMLNAFGLLANKLMIAPFIRDSIKTFQKKQICCGIKFFYLFLCVIIKKKSFKNACNDRDGF